MVSLRRHMMLRLLSMGLPGLQRGFCPRQGGKQTMFIL